MENKNTVEEVYLKKAAKPRLDYLDIAKGIAIFLVVIGHVANPQDAPYYRMVIYTFHMPLFFLVSGSLTKRHSHYEKYNLKNLGIFVKKNFFALVVPYIIWALIFMPFDIKAVPYLFYGSRWGINKAATNSALWFLPCLFSSRIIVELLLWLSTKFKIHRKFFAAIAAAAMFVLAFTLPVPEMQLPWGLSQAPMAAGFILLGYIFKDTMDLLHKKSILLHSVILASAIIVFVIGVYAVDGLELVLIVECRYGDPIRFLCNAVSGCVMVMTVSSLIAKIPEQSFGDCIHRFLSWLGRSTMGIYLIHLPIARNLIGPAVENVFSLPKSSFAGGFVSGAVSLVISCVLVAIIERYIPQLFGKELGKP